MSAGLTAFRWQVMLLLAAACLAFFTGCSRETTSGPAATNRLQVVTTLFPLYDFARAIAGNRAEVRLLLPPGSEPHTFEPKPEDILAINRAALFVYTNRFMEPWAEDLVKGVPRDRLTVVDASAGLVLLDAAVGHDHGHGAMEEGNHDEPSGKDPHIWLDLTNAEAMIDTILAGFVARDPANRDYYTANAAAYKGKLAELDRRYRATLGTCKNRTLLHAGHAAFAYLARRYGITYVSATGVAADAQTTPTRMAELVKRVRALKLQYIFSEELVSPRVAETIAAETGARILRLHAAHNISKDELAAGVTFPDLMERNLAALATGLQCRQ